MENIHRFRTEQILKDLEKKMVFIVGPRQVGKTHLSKEIAKKFTHTTYLNYDNRDDREDIKKMTWTKNTDLLILDEIHKMSDWKNFLKGVFDTKEESLRILVIGSARLEAYKKVGDSLAGRFFVHHLMPLSLSELKDSKYQKNIDFFLKRGGFPEPFLAESDLDADRWRSFYIDSLIKGDVLSFDRIQDVSLMENIFELLRRKVGSPISYSSIARDVETSPTTVKKYITVLESLYIIFKVPTYSKKISRSILKNEKIYFFDTGLVVGDSGVIFENFVAISLLKHKLQKNELLGQKNKLMYIRDKEGREVDFVLVHDSAQTQQMIEVKVSDTNVSKNLKYFKDRYNFSAMQLVKEIRHNRDVDDTLVQNAEEYLENL